MDCPQRSCKGYRWYRCRRWLNLRHASWLRWGAIQLDCEDCALHCNAIPTASPGLLDLLGSLSSKNSWIMVCALGIHAESPTSTKSCSFFCSLPLPRRHFSRGPWDYRVVPASSSKHARDNEHEYSVPSKRDSISMVASSQPRVSCTAVLLSFVAIFELILQLFLVRVLRIMK